VVNPACGGTLPIPPGAGLLGIKNSAQQPADPVVNLPLQRDGTAGNQDKQNLIVENKIYVKRNLWKMGMPVTEFRGGVQLTFSGLIVPI